MAEAARRKALLLSDQLESKTAELALALTEHADLEQELGRVTPDLRREVLEHQRSLDDASSPHSWAHEPSSPFEAGAVMTCDVGCQAGTLVTCVDASSQVTPSSTVSVGCQAEAMTMHASMQTVACDVQTLSVGCQAEDTTMHVSMQCDVQTTAMPAVPCTLTQMAPLDTAPPPSPTRLLDTVRHVLPSSSTLHQALHQVPEALALRLQQTRQLAGSWMAAPKHINWQGWTQHANGLDTPAVKMAWLPVAALCILARPFAVCE